MSAQELIYGIHAVLSVIRSQPDRVLELWVDQGRRDARIRELVETARHRGLQVQHVEARTLARKVGDVGHQGIVARCRAAPALREGDLPEILDAVLEPVLVLVLDGVTDPHNLGACLRSAEAAGVHLLIVPTDRAAPLTPAVRKIACGAAERVPFIMVKNLARTLRLLQARGIWLYGTDDAAKTVLYDADLTGSVALLMGAEGRGLRRLTRELCDHLVSLPMAGQAESLNVSVAAGICLYEALRQRKYTTRKTRSSTEQKWIFALYLIESYTIIV